MGNKPRVLLLVILISLPFPIVGDEKDRKSIYIVFSENGDVILEGAVVEQEALIEAVERYEQNYNLWAVCISGVYKNLRNDIWDELTASYPVLPCRK